MFKLPPGELKHLLGYPKRLPEARGVLLRGHTQKVIEFELFTFIGKCRLHLKFNNLFRLVNIADVPCLAEGGFRRIF